MGYREAIINIVEDKVAFCAEYGVVINSDQWESSPLPDQMLADRGAMEGKIADNLTSGLGVQLSNTAPYRPDWKAYVEKIFDLMNKKVIHRLPGSVPQDPEFGQSDYRHQSIFTFREFTKIVLHMVIDYNQNHRMPNYPMDADMIADGLEPYPNEIYEWGCKKRSVPSRQHSIEEVKIHLLPNEEATVKESGIKFRGLYYTCDLEVKEGWREKAKNLNEWKIKVAFHPRKVEPIYIGFGDGRPSVECYLIDRKSPFIRCEWDEVKDYISDKNLKNNLAEGRTRQTGSDLWENINKIKKTAEKRNKNFKKNGVNQSKSAQIQNIGKNMSEEIEYANQVERVKSANISSLTLDTEEVVSKHITAKNSLSVQELRRRKEERNKK